MANMVWNHLAAVTAGDGGQYTLELNTEELTWGLSVVETLPFRSDEGVGRVAFS